MCFSVCRESGKKPQADGEAAAAAGARPRDFCLPRRPKRHVPHENGYILYTCMHLVAGLGDSSLVYCGNAALKNKVSYFFGYCQNKKAPCQLAQTGTLNTQSKVIR